MWTAIASVAAVFAAIFAGFAWLSSKKTLNYVKSKDIPDLWLEKDRFVYGEYKIEDTTKWQMPIDVPGQSVCLKNYNVSCNGEDKFNRKCIIFNSSLKNSSEGGIDNYTGIFGELCYVNRGELGIRKIELKSCKFTMKNKEEISLTPEGSFDVDIERGGTFIAFIAYLYDTSARCLCNQKYIENGKLNKESMDLKKNFNDQLRCTLPVIIDEYDKLETEFILSAQDGKKYCQKHIIEIKTSGNGGVYCPSTERAELIN